MQPRSYAASLVMLFAAAAMLIGPPTARAQGRKIRVPQDHPTIQQAINFADDGDTVIVDDGVWTGPGNTNVDTIRKEITIRSANGPSATTIDGKETSQAFIISSGGPPVQIEGITIINGNAGQGGAVQAAGPVTIKNCTLRNNVAYDGGAVFGQATLESCIVSENSARYGGGANSITSAANCFFHANRATEWDGGGVYTPGGGVLANCMFVDNSAANTGGAIYSWGGGTIITNCTFYGNVAGRSGGAIGGLSVIIGNSILWSNRPDQIGYPPIRVTFSDIQGGWPGNRNIDADPLFVTGPLGHFYLSQRKAGQDVNSPCLDAGDGRAKELGLKKFTTRTDIRPDKRAVDMGYHYPR